MINIDPIPGLKELRSACNDVTEDTIDRLTGELFPLLDMEEWTRTIVSSIPKGSVISFGCIARTLGTLNASRSVGSIVSAMQNDLPGHRVVYSDGRVPDSSMDLLEHEVDLKRKNDGIHVDPGIMITGVDMDDPPFISLKENQLLMAKRMKGPEYGSLDLAWIDISSKGEDHICAVCNTDLQGEVKGRYCYRGKPGIPYVSGFLFYREGALILPAVSKALDNGIVDSDTLLVMDGNGRIHPRFNGIACQVGAAMDMKTCGVAKRLICGSLSEWARTSDTEEKASVFIYGKLAGYASRNRKGSPIFISAGHRSDLDNVFDTLSRTKVGRLPNPIREAHNEANRFRRSETPSSDL